MATYSKDTIPICTECDNLSDNHDITKSCLRCGVSYCSHFASHTDVRYCANCLADFSIKETIMEKTIERVHEDGSTTISRKSIAKHTTLQGTDWLFQCKLICETPDNELDAAIEYHRANVGLLLSERESRKLERIKKLASIKLPNIKHESQEQREKREAKEAASKNKKTRVKEKSVASISQLAELLSKLSKGTLSADSIKNMLEQQQVSGQEKV